MTYSIYENLKVVSTFQEMTDMRFVGIHVTSNMYGMTFLSIPVVLFMMKPMAH